MCIRDRNIAACMKCDITGFIVNEYSRLLCQIEGEHNYQLFFKGTTRLLANYVASHNAVLPSSVRRLNSFTELLLLFLRLTILNPVLYSFFVALCNLHAHKGKHGQTSTASHVHSNRLHHEP
eukprot:TRINITY_DN6809_c0_g4_i1.p1 TRINITY_DN6809_c0_g4~~TRINITY_DN6809_c0_g4_i1.p1  ORF type:complete len:122 (-),score=0.63 TRINITY_DN6809_c0_g4_i1:166-531(-)